MNETEKQSWLHRHCVVTEIHPQSLLQIMAETILSWVIWQATTQLVTAAFRKINTHKNRNGGLVCIGEMEAAWALGCFSCSHPETTKACESALHWACIPRLSITPSTVSGLFYTAWTKLAKLTKHGAKSRRSGTFLPVCAAHVFAHGDRAPAGPHQL